MKRLHIEIKGVVQGVGFRPFVYNLAQHLNLKGFVTNTSKGVTIEIEGERVEEFISKLQNNPPPLAKIYSIKKTELSPNNYKTFEIIESIDETGFTHVSEDVSICEDCLRELFTPTDRRYLYPFINCTNCGPRYTITMKVPYDRPNTTMAVFKMCPECLSEYKDPSNRRFHAQPNACPVCGPQVRLFVKEGSALTEIENPIPEAIRLIKEGKILAIRGLGGFHLCCDARNEDAVKELRKRKKRSNKPFALMSPSVEAIEKFCFVSDEERKILISLMRPIVLLRKKPQCNLPEALATNNAYLGFMLPYTPLHYLLFYYPAKGGDSSSFSLLGMTEEGISRHFVPRNESKTDTTQPYKDNSALRSSAFSLQPHFDVLVMTSGNISEEPIITKNEEALEKLNNVADAFLIHNRDIFMRVDDSVVRELEGRIYFIRRARGFVPKAIFLKEELPEVLGAGADLKNTFTLIKSDYAIMSQHIGDMENLETIEFYEEVLNNLKAVYRTEPSAVGHDLHPMYFSTSWAKDYAEKKCIPAFALQHHYCHIASLMAEHGLDELFGIAFDGTGYGTDGTIWGSEFLYCTLKDFQRLAHLKPISLPGGENAIKECYRIALSLIDDAFGEDMDLIKKLPLFKEVSEEKIKQILKIKRLSQFSPLSSGMGRLFDGVSSLIGVCHYNTHEAEAAIALESLIEQGREFSERDCYPFELMSYPEGETLIIDYREMIREILKDVFRSEVNSSCHSERKRGISRISWKFHNTIIRIILELTEHFRAKSGFDTVGLSGGVFQNAYLVKETIKALRKLGIKPFYHINTPSNDACISLGQAYIVGKRIKT
ncbi:carbamoyltransferase HypF [Thermodesulfovibrio sp. Kuro-1]|uniref:carbamoyltransferase HypF n=1 Tax=Thermodesulfovibrio sp. Kuro-1 TaxID=2580394 RepID=UPI0011443BEC|nr:carbamoyltransferase HypF [Thermodesulfovibrio sp. Kuro-1]